MAETDTLALLLEEVGLAFSPLAEALESVENFELYARELGWEVTAIPPSLQALQTPLRALQNVLDAGSLDAAAISDFIALLHAVVEAINRIQSAPAAELPPLPGFAAEFPQQVLDRSIVDYLMQGYPVVGAILRLVGVIEIEPVPAAPGRLAYTSRRINWAAIAGVFENPLATLDAAYDWSAGFQAERFLANLHALLVRLGLHIRLSALPDAVGESLFGPLPDGGVGALAVQIAGDRYTTYGFQLGVYVASTPDAPGLVAVPYAQGALGARLDVSEDLAILIEGQGTFEGGFAVVLRPGDGLHFLSPAETGPATELDTAVLLGFEVTPDEEGPRTLIGAPGGSRFEFVSAGARVGGQFSSGRDPVLIAQTELKGGRIVIDLAGADGFLAEVLPPDGFAFDVDLIVGVNSESGLYFGGSAGLEIFLPAHVSLGPIEIDGALLAFKLKDGAFVLEMGATLNTDLAVLKASIENMGLQADLRFVADGAGNAGVVDLAFAFKPPTGVGLAVDAGVVKGGGFLRFDPHKEQYDGILELDLSGIVSVKAIALITTRLPDGSKGFSLLLILTAEFGSPIQLGLGFTLSAVGGLLGLNRTMRLEAIATGIRDGGINSIMFPQNVIENASRIISDLKSYFPVEEGTFLIGPMVKIGWGTPNLVTVSLGVIIEIPGNIAILGVLKVVLPDEEAALIVIQVNFIGAIEFDKKRLWFFAAIFESRVLFITLEGEMGLLVGWGDDPTFVVSVGGFHPAFNPPPLPFGAIARISISILNTDFARIQVQGYFAVTSNSVQFGAAVELYFGLDAFNIDGHLAFDALFRFSPFYFIISISSSLSVKVFGVGLFSVRMRGSLEGPTPWHVEGTGSISLLFFDIDVDFSHTWGEEAETTLPPISVMPLLVDEYQKSENWLALLPAANQLLVSLRGTEETVDLILHPVGSLKVSQRAVPLDLTIDKVGNQKPSDANRFDVSVGSAGLDVQGTIQESFAVGQYFDKSDEELLNARSFEPMKGGLELSVAGEQYHSPRAVRRIVRYEKIIIDTYFERFVQKFYVWFGALFGLFLNGNAVSKASISYKQQKELKPFAQQVQVGAATYGVAYNSDNTAFSEDAVNFTSQVQAQEFMKQQVATDPNLAKELHVIPQVEMQGVE